MTDEQGNTSAEDDFTVGWPDAEPVEEQAELHYEQLASESLLNREQLTRVEALGLAHGLLTTVGGPTGGLGAAFMGDTGRVSGTLIPDEDFAAMLTFIADYILGEDVPFAEVVDDEDSVKLRDSADGTTLRDQSRREFDAPVISVDTESVNTEWKGY